MSKKEELDGVVTDTCPAPALTDGTWQQCGNDNTTTVVFAGTPAQRFCDDHVGTAQPQVG